MTHKEKILELAQDILKLKTSDVVDACSVSRQFGNRLLREMVGKGQLLKFGGTRNSYYTLPRKIFLLEDQASLTLENKDLQEHIVLQRLEAQTPLLNTLPDNIQSIFDYAFSEMTNNAIEHSKSKKIEVSAGVANDFIFRVHDSGIGVFRNVMNKRKLHSELEAIQDLLKGKTTTAPKAHSGEGIFFTSKIADLFSLESFGYKLTIDNRIPDIFIEEVSPIKKGTRVFFQVSMGAKKHLSEVFDKYRSAPDEPDFGKTEVQVRLYSMGTVHVSRSQARRILTGLEKFKIVVLDFAQVPSVGQAFADEIFRVFKAKHPEIEIRTKNMVPTVQFMIERAQNA